MQHVLPVVILSAIASPFHGFGESSQNPNLFFIPEDYAKSEAPRQNNSGPMLCIVQIHLSIWAINQISLQKQDLEVDITVNVAWKDYRLTVNPNISLGNFWPPIHRTEAEQIWTPTLLFRNCKGCTPISLPKGEILYASRKSGFIVAQMRLLHRFTCDIDLRAYPMDTQFCQIQLYTFESQTDVIQLHHRYPNMTVNVDSNLTLSEYHIAPIIRESCVVHDAENDAYSCVELRIRLRHLITYHLMTSYIPTSFIVMLSWISFWLPLELAPARVALGLTSLLTLATRLDQAQRNLPPVSYAKAIDVWMFACIFMVSSCLCEFAFSHYQHELSKMKINVPSRKIKVRPFMAKKNKLVFREVAPLSPASDQTMNYTFLDRISRIVFPSTFLLFNIVYWSYYLTYYN